MTKTTDKSSNQNTLTARLGAFFGIKKTFSLSERMDLIAHRDAWLAKRNSRLEKKVKFYSY